MVEGCEEKFSTANNYQTEMNWVSSESPHNFLKFHLYSLVLEIQH